MKKFFLFFSFAFLTCFGIVANAQSNCDLSLVIGSNLICNADNTYTVSVQALYTNAPTTGFLVVEGVSQAITGTGQTHYVTFPGDGSTNYVDAYFSANPACSATSVAITGPNCLAVTPSDDCYINVVISSDLGCDPVTGMIDVMVTVYYDSVPAGSQLVIEGTPYTPTSSPQTVMLQVQGNGSTYVFDAFFSNISGCNQASTSLMVPNCTPCNFDCNGICNGPTVPGVACNDNNANTINDMIQSSCVCAGTPLPACTPGTACNDGNPNTTNDMWNANCQCVGTQVFTAISISSMTTSVANGYYTVYFQASGGNGVYSSSNGSFNGSSFTSAQIPCGQNYTFTVYDSANSTPASITVTAPCSNTNPCSGFTISQTNYECQSTGGQWTLSFALSGGQAPYNIFGSYTDEAFTGTSFSVSGEDGSSIEINVTDANGCSITYQESNILCIKCTYALSMNNLTPQSVCGNGTVSGSSTLTDPDSHWPENGVTTYVIHTSSGNSLGTILGYNNSGTFSFSQLSGAQYGVTYYLSAVGGPDDNADGVADFTDACTKVANGIPVTFTTGGAITVSLSTTCNETTGETTVMVYVSGGNPAPYYYITGTTNGSYLPSQLPLSIIASDGTSVSFSVTDNNACSSSGSAAAGPFECKKTPISLLDFSGTATKNGNLLVWTSGSEIQNDFYTLSKSTDGVNFEFLAEINGSGTINYEKSYDFLDEKASAGLTYYSLSQTDMDGSTVNLGVIQVTRVVDHFGSLNIFPVPASSEISVNFEMIEAGEVTINIFDMAGKLVNQINKSATSGLNNTKISINTLPNGIYQLQVATDGQKVSSKFIKN